MQQGLGYRRKTLTPLTGTILSGAVLAIELGDIFAYVVRRKAASTGTLIWKPGTFEAAFSDGHELTATQPSSDRVECQDTVITICAAGGDVVYDVRREGFDRGTE